MANAGLELKRGSMLAALAWPLEVGLGPSTPEEGGGGGMLAALAWPLEVGLGPRKL